MSKLKHSKGPWVVVSDWEGDYIVVDQNDENVAVASGYAGTLSISLNEDNARLIAAAPEMLNYLIEMSRSVKEICRGCDYYSSINDCDKENCYQSDHKKIVEKATGMTIEEVLKDE